MTCILIDRKIMALFEIVNCCDNWIWSPALYFQQPGCESLGRVGIRGITEMPK